MRSSPGASSSRPSEDGDNPSTRYLTRGPHAVMAARLPISADRLPAGRPEHLLRQHFRVVGVEIAGRQVPADPLSALFPIYRAGRLPASQLTRIFPHDLREMAIHRRCTIL